VPWSQGHGTATRSTFKSNQINQIIFNKRTTRPLTLQYKRADAPLLVSQYDSKWVSKANIDDWGTTFKINWYADYSNSYHWLVTTGSNVSRLWLAGCCHGNRFGNRPAVSWCQFAIDPILLVHWRRKVGIVSLSSLNCCFVIRSDRQCHWHTKHHCFLSKVTLEMNIFIVFWSRQIRNLVDLTNMH